MVSTRSSTGAAGSSPKSNKSTPSKNSGTKRKADEASPSSKSKRGRPSNASKEQKTIEETMPDVEDDEQTLTKDEEIKDSEMVEAEANGSVEAKSEDSEKAETHGDEESASIDDESARKTDVDGDGETKNSATNDGKVEDTKQPAAGSEHAKESAEESTEGPSEKVEKSAKPTQETDAANEATQPSKKATEPTKKSDGKEDPEAGNAFDQVKADAGEAGTTTATESEQKNDENEAPQKEQTAAADAVEEDKEREKAMPSNILEKGIIYFFTRGRVGVEDPDSVQDLARSYFVLRPLPDGAKLTDGAIQDIGNNRLLALPKKVWPKSGKDRFMVFVEKAKASMDTLKEDFFSGSEYTTQTVGTRQMPEITPLGEGVYAITSTGGGQGTSHLAYMLTIPTDIGEVQTDVGLKEKGSFVLSVKNPEASSPPNAQLPATAEYPKDIIEEFRGRNWMPLHPKHIDYNNASLLLIGEDFDSSSNLEPAPKDEKHDEKVTPEEELEKLEKEDELRVEHLKGDDTIFADLGISSKDYPKVMTTW